MLHHYVSRFVTSLEQSELVNEMQEHKLINYMLSQVPRYAQWVVSILIKGPEEKDCKRCSNRGNNKSEIQPYNQIMPRLPGCLFKFIQKQPPQKSYWCKKTDEVFLEISHNIHKESICVRVSFLRFTKKETLAQLFSCEFCKISKNTFFTEQLWTTASLSIKHAHFQRGCFDFIYTPMFSYRPPMRSFF